MLPILEDQRILLPHMLSVSAVQNVREVACDFLALRTRAHPLLGDADEAVCIYTQYHGPTHLNKMRAVSTGSCTPN